MRQTTLAEKSSPAGAVDELDDYYEGAERRKTYGWVSAVLVDEFNVGPFECADISSLSLCGKRTARGVFAFDDPHESLHGTIKSTTPLLIGFHRASRDSE